MFDTDNPFDDKELDPPNDAVVSPPPAYTQVILASQTLHSDLTGRFPVTSRNGAQYLFVSVLDGYIHVETMKTRHHAEYIDAYKRTLNFFARFGRRPAFQRLDNETSAPLEAFALTNKITIQYCPPHTHRSLKAERAIRTLKNHFIATLCTADPDFPLNLWDDMLPQVEICLNHLIPYSPNVTVSAYAGLHGGAFDFASHPIAPIGTRVLIHDKPAVRASWAPHGVPGYYLGPALQQYRAYRVWSTPTNTTRVTDTVAWFPHRLTVPGPSVHETLTSTINNLRTALRDFAATTPDIRRMPQPPSTLIDSVTDNLHIVANMHLPSLLPSAVPETPILVIPAAEQRVATAPSSTGTGLEQRMSLVPPITSTPETTLTGPNTLLQATHRPSIPSPPQLIMSLVQPAYANTALNLDERGQPLTYASAKAGTNAAQWQHAESEELDRLIATNTIRPLQYGDQPLLRWRDTTYYNPQPKEKETADGQRTYRIRGTIGGDRVNYPGPTAARTAAMSLVKILLHSVISDNAQWLTIDMSMPASSTRMATAMSLGCVAMQASLPPTIASGRLKPAMAEQPLPGTRLLLAWCVS